MLLLLIFITKEILIEETGNVEHINVRVFLNLLLLVLYVDVYPESKKTGQNQAMI
jgi:hypothetical protein